MVSLRLEDIVDAIDGKVVLNGIHSFNGVSIDSRTIQEGELFIALRGKRFDGHDFLQEALKIGSGAIVSVSVTGDEIETGHLQGKTIVSVEDPLKALQSIAYYIRLKRNIPVIGITGSNGKTTTKELIASILNTKYRVLKNAGNLNNHIGLPLTLTKVDEADEVAVLEMGASAPGEIRELCKIATPDYGVLTNVSPCHLEGFKDMVSLRRTKLEILDYVNVAIVNAADDFLMEGVKTSGFNGRLVRYGIKNDAEVYATDIRLHGEGSTFYLHLGKDESIEVNPKISGRFNISNILAAAAVGYLFTISPRDIKTAIESFKGVPMRLEIKEQRGLKVISDVYNANPASMEEAIRELARLKNQRAVAVLGDMLELGMYEEEAHRRIVRWMSSLPIDIFIAVGPVMSSVASEFTGKVYKAQDAGEARKILNDICREGDTVLIKGSRGMRMEKVLET